MKSVGNILRYPWLYPILVLLSLATTFAHAGPLYGTKIALALTVFFQLYLPGLLVARALGKMTTPHPITRFAWTLAAGIGLVTSVGGLARLLHVPVPSFLLMLHGLMFALALVRPARSEVVEVWRLSRHKIPQYLLLFFCCGVVLLVSMELNQFRHNGLEDQSVFVSAANWLANDPDDPGLRFRLAGVTVGDVRHDTDGWTYNQAAWVWSSGVPAAEILWYDLAPLFSWTIPLIIFALAYEVTGREEAAAWSAAALALIGLLTLDGLVYRQTNLAFGGYGLFHLNTLRMFSRAVGLPLALFTALAYLRSPRLPDLMVVFLIGIAMAMMHPNQLMIFDISIGATAALWWLAQPTRQRTRHLLSLALVLASLVILPYLQREYQAFDVSSINASVADELSSASQAEDLISREASVFLPLRDVPIIGNTFILNPALFFYHPLIAISCILGLIAGLAWRKSLATQHVFAATAMTLLLLFTPAITPLFVRLTFSAAAPGMAFMLPLALIGGLTLDAAIGYLSRHSPGGGAWLASSCLAVSILVLLFEPIPIPASARDQLHASNEFRILRDIRPTDELLVERLQSLLPSDRRSIVLAPNRNANYIIESVGHTIITGGRITAGNHISYLGTARFFNEIARPAPWLDGVDFAFINEFAVTHIIIRADDTRLPQLLLQTDRFEYMDASAGYVIFRVQPSLVADPVDDLFERMNRLYQANVPPRWGPQGFALTFPGDADEWGPIANEWEDMLNGEPGNDLARHGLAFSYMMMGEDALALPLWEQLHQTYPDVALYTHALASTWNILEDAESASNLLLETLDRAEPVAQVLAAKSLLTETFFYRLNASQLDAVIAVTEREGALWNEFAVFESVSDVRQRVSLLMNAGRWDTAEAWLATLPEIVVSPQDVVTAASIDLAQGELDNALARLRLATDADWLTAKIFLNPDGWQNNTAAQMYYLLLGEIAFREARWQDAEAVYQQAIALGATLPGRYFLAQVLNAAGQENRAEELLAQVDTEWNESHDTPFPELVSLLAIADHQALYVMQSEVNRGDESSLSVTATYGNIKPSAQAYPIRSWRFQILSQDSASRLAVLEVPAVFVDGALVRVSTEVHLPGDIAPLTPAHVNIEPRYDNAITTGSASMPVTLNRPSSAPIPVAAHRLEYQFATGIELEGYAINHATERLEMTLYWQTASPLAEDYQVFVHVLDDEGQVVAQHDSGPVNGRYPSSQWRSEVVIADTHTILFDESLDAGQYDVRIGLYRLSDGTRLTISPLDEHVENDSVLVYRFEQ